MISSCDKFLTILSRNNGLAIFLMEAPSVYVGLLSHGFR
jgi:hypothetical protein